eukprot:4197280-Prymnesium_polylepis.1
MELTPGEVKTSQAALDAAAEEACAEAEEADRRQQAQENINAKAAKAQAILAHEEAKTQPVGKVRVCLPFHLLLDDLPATEKARYLRAVQAVLCCMTYKQKAVRMIEERKVDMSCSYCGSGRPERAVVG